MILKRNETFSGMPMFFNVLLCYFHYLKYFQYILNIFLGRLAACGTTFPPVSLPHSVKDNKAKAAALWAMRLPGDQWMYLSYSAAPHKLANLPRFVPQKREEN